MSADVAQTAPLMELENVSKAFPGCLANDSVDLVLNRGSIHALLGQNGAGKSTLVKIMYGLLQADQGRLSWNGSPVVIKNPAMARALGIAMVFQHFSLFDSLTVLENISLGLDPAQSGGTALASDSANGAVTRQSSTGFGRLNLEELRQKTIEVSETYGLPLDPDRPVYTLSVGERQRIEIVRCLLQQPSLLIMDEPTSVLTPQEVATLFDTLRRLRDEGMSILYISHKLDEIRQLCSEASVLRDGRLVARTDPRTESSESLAATMIGQELASPVSTVVSQPGSSRLTIDRLSIAVNDSQSTGLSDISLQVRAGEILGIAGVAGNGQAELMSVISGETRLPTPETIGLDDIAVAHLPPARRRRLGLCCVPEERLGHAAIPGLSLSDNALLTAFHRMRLSRGGWINRSRCESFTDQIIADYAVQCTGRKALASSLSGGNLQKFVVGREILQAPSVLVISQPTWGVDAGAAAAIHDALRKLAQNGAAVLLISQDLDELMLISHNIAAICAGEVSQVYPTRDISAADIGMLMGGRELTSQEKSQHVV